MKDNRISSSKIFSSFFWVLVEKFGYSGISLLCTLILARLLEPYEFGLVGTVTIIISISNMIVDSGLGAALVNKKDITISDCNTMFTFNLFISIILFLTIFFSAPYIAKYFEKPILRDIIRVLSTTMIFNAIATVQRVILVRNLLFKKQSLISIISLIISAIITIFMAYDGWGVWAIVAQSVLYSLIFTIIISLSTRYTPRIQFSFSSFKELIGFGGPVILSSAIQIGYNDVISSVIAKLYNIQLTGFYTQSKKLVDFPIGIFQSLFSSAVFPILSKAKDKQEFQMLASKINKGIYFLAFPLLLIIPFNTESIIYIVLGKKWVGANEIFTILSISVIISLISSAKFNILKSAGKGKILLNAGIARAIVGFTTLAALATFSINFLLYGIIFTNLIALIIGINYVNLTTLYDIKRQIRDISIPLIIASVANISALIIVKMVKFEEQIFSLLLYITIMLLIFIIQCLLFNIRELNFIIEKIKK